MTTIKLTLWLWFVTATLNRAIKNRILDEMCMVKAPQQKLLLFADRLKGTLIIIVQLFVHIRAVLLGPSLIPSYTRVRAIAARNLNKRQRHQGPPNDINLGGGGRGSARWMMIGIILYCELCTYKYARGLDQK